MNEQQFVLCVELTLDMRNLRNAEGNNNENVQGNMQGNQFNNREI